MRVKCLHGFFIFDEREVADVSRFMSKTGLSLVPWRDSFTFEDIAEAPDYSIKGKDLMGTPALETFEGEPWEVFEENGIVYNFGTGLFPQILTVSTTSRLELSGNRYLSPGLLVPGTLLPSGDRIKSYTGYWLRDSGRWLYSEVTLV